MNDREKDLSLLKRFCSEKKHVGFTLIVITFTTAVIIGLAELSLLRGSASLVLVALLSCVSLMIILIQYYVAGPLFREVQRLKDEIDSLKTK